MKKEYELQNGKTVVFEYDENRIGKVTVEAMDCLIDMLPKWIPCSERLPEMEKTILVSTEYGTVREATFKGFNSKEETLWLIHGVVMFGDEVVSWMPMPEPYKEENE